MGRASGGTRRPSDQAARGSIPANLAFAALLETIKNAETGEGRRHIRLSLNRFARKTRPKK